MLIFRFICARSKQCIWYGRVSFTYLDQLAIEGGREEQPEERPRRVAETSNPKPAGRSGRGPSAREAVEVDEGFFWGWGGGVRISATTPEFRPFFFQISAANYPS
jgi:hypothetical protein